MSSKDILKKIAELSIPTRKNTEALDASIKDYAGAGNKYDKIINTALNSLGGYKDIGSTSQYKNLYELYKKNYQGLGEIAAAETIKAGNELDGGYGNDYVQAATSAAYNKYMSDMGAAVPSLMNAASSAYAGDRAAEFDRISALQRERAAEQSKAKNRYNIHQEYNNKKYESQQKEYSGKLSILKNQYNLQYAAEQKAAKEAAARAKASRAKASKSVVSTQQPATKQNKSVSAKDLYAMAAKEIGNAGIMTPTEFSRRGYTWTTNGRHVQKAASYGEYIEQMYKKYGKTLNPSGTGKPSATVRQMITVSKTSTARNEAQAHENTLALLANGSIFEGFNKSLKRISNIVSAGKLNTYSNKYSLEVLKNDVKATKELIEKNKARFNSKDYKTLVNTITEYENIVNEFMSVKDAYIKREKLKSEKAKETVPGWVSDVASIFAAANTATQSSSTPDVKKIKDIYDENAERLRKLTDKIEEQTKKIVPHLNYQALDPKDEDYKEAYKYKTYSLADEIFTNGDVNLRATAAGLGNIRAYEEELNDPQTNPNAYNALKQKYGIGEDYKPFVSNDDEKYLRTVKEGVKKYLTEKGLKPDAELVNDVSKELVDEYKRAATSLAMRETKEQAAKLATEHPIIGTFARIAETPAKIKGAVYSLAKGAEDIFSDKPVYSDPNNVAFSASQFTRSYDEAFENKYAKKNWQKFVYETGISMGEFLSLAPLNLVPGGEALTLTIMGTAAASDVALSLSEQGFEAADTAFFATAAGLAEAVTEKVSIDALFKTASSRTLKQLIKNVIYNAIPEASEEVASNLINYTADVVYGAVTGKQTQRDKAIKEKMEQSGLSYTEAAREYLQEQIKDTVLSGLGGALSGAVMGGTQGAFQYAGATKSAGRNVNLTDRLSGNGKTATNVTSRINELNNWLSENEKLKGTKEYNAVQKELNDLNANGGSFKTQAKYGLAERSTANNLIQEGFSSDNNKIRTLAAKAAASLSNGSLAENELGRLANEISANKTAGSIGIALSLLENEGQRVQSAFADALNGNELSKAEVKTIQSSPTALALLSDLSGTEITKNSTTEEIKSAASRAYGSEFSFADISSGQKAVFSAGYNLLNNRAIGQNGFKAMTTADVNGADIEKYTKFFTNIYELAKDGKSENYLHSKFDDFATEFTGNNTSAAEIVMRAFSSAQLDKQAEKTAQAEQNAEKPKTVSKNKKVATQGESGKISTTDRDIKIKTKGDNVTVGKKNKDIVKQEDRNERKRASSAKEYIKKQVSESKNISGFIANVQNKRFDTKNGGLTIDENVDTSKWKKGKMAFVAYFDYLGKKRGVTYRIAANSVSGNEAFGSFSNENGRPVITLSDTDVPTLTATAGHEIGHYLAQAYADDFEQLKAYVFSFLKDNGYNFEAGRKAVLNAYKAEFEGMTEAERAAAVDEEIVCNSMFSVDIAGEDFKAFVTENASLAERIAICIEDFLNNLAEFFKAVNHTAEIGFLRDDTRYLREVADYVREILQGEKNNSSEKTKKYLLKPYSENQINNWKNSDNIVIYKSQEQLQQFIDNARAHKNLNKKIYFGIISDGVADFIQNKIGIDVHNFNATLRADSILKIFNSHGNEIKEALRGQRAITDSDILQLPRLLGEIDSVTYEGKYTKMQGNNDVINAKSSLEPLITMCLIVQGRHLDIRLQTMYAKKGSNAVAANTENQPLPVTPETGNGNASFNNSISNSNEKNNPKVKKSLAVDYEKAVEEGNTEKAQQLVNEAAMAWGAYSADGKKPLMLYHGTNTIFNTFDLMKSGKNYEDYSEGLFFFTNKKSAYPDSATDYAKSSVEKGGGTETIINAYIKTLNPLIITFNPFEAYNAVAYYDINHTKIYDKWFFGEYDSIIIKCNDSSHDDSLLVLTDNSSSIKSADAVTYDDNGNVIPLNERFSDKSDIRYSKDTGDLYKNALKREIYRRAKKDKGSTKLNSRSTAEEYKRIEAEIRKQRANGYSLEQKKERASLISGNIEQLRQTSLNLADAREILAKEVITLRNELKKADAKLKIASVNEEYAKSETKRTYGKQVSRKEFKAFVNNLFKRMGVRLSSGQKLDYTLRLQNMYESLWNTGNTEEALKSAVSIAAELYQNTYGKNKSVSIKEYAESKDGDFSFMAENYINKTICLDAVKDGDEQQQKRYRWYKNSDYSVSALNEQYKGIFKFKLGSAVKLDEVNFAEPLRDLSSDTEAVRFFGNELTELEDALPVLLDKADLLTEDYYQYVNEGDAEEAYAKKRRQTLETRIADAEESISYAEDYLSDPDAYNAKLDAEEFEDYPEFYDEAQAQEEIDYYKSELNAAQAEYDYAIENGEFPMTDSEIIMQEALNLVEASADIVRRTTFADKKADEINTLRKSYRDKVKAAQAEARTKADEYFAAQIKSKEERFNRQLSAAEMRAERKIARKDRELQEYKDTSQANIARARERKKKREFCNKIAKVLRQISNYAVTNNRQKHIPLELQSSVETFFNAVANLDRVDSSSDYNKMQEAKRRYITGGNEVTYKSLAKELDISLSELTRYSRTDISVQAGRIIENPTTWAELRKKYRAGNIEIDDVVKFSSAGTWQNGFLNREINSALEKINRVFKETSGNNNYSDLAVSYSDVLEEQLNSLLKRFENKTFSQMTSEDMKEVYKFALYLRASINNVNKMFAGARKATIEQTAEKALEEIKIQCTNKHRLRLINTFSSVLKPEYMFEFLGSPTLKEQFNNLTKGEDTYSKDLYEAREVEEVFYNTYGAHDWDFEERSNFVTENGDTIDISLGEKMTIYALSRQDEGMEHLLGDGIFIDDDNTKKAIKKARRKNDEQYLYEHATSCRLTFGDINIINASLTSQQKQFVSAMVSYLANEMGNKGNEVTRKLYGINIFTNKLYFPIEVYKSLMKRNPAEKNGSVVRLRNLGFTKSRKPYAKNCLLIRDFADVWGGHVKQMSLYHSWVLPLEDFERVLNYSNAKNNPKEGVSGLNNTIEIFYGKNVQQYINNLIDDLNGNNNINERTKFLPKAINRFKKSAVLYSASVAIQQPAAITRAMAYIRPYHFVGNVSPETYREMLKYCPVARLKEMGSFDTNVGTSAVEYLKITKNNNEFLRGIKDKDFVRSGKAVMNTIDEIGAKGAELGDRLGWTLIWNACKHEQKHLYPKLTKEELLRKAADRFGEVVRLTQVYDSVLTRSDIMRSRDPFAQIATAFMAEPTTSLNMLINGVYQFKNGKRHLGSKIILAVIAETLVTAALKSLVQAGREDDENESYGEAYAEKFLNNTIENLNPLTMLPFVKDVWSILRGYDVERTDMSLISDLKKAWGNMMSDDSTWQDTLGFITAALSALGIPAANVQRDFINLPINLWKKRGLQATDTLTREYALKGIKEALLMNGKIDKERLMYNALINADKATFDRFADDYKDLDRQVMHLLKKYNADIDKAAHAQLDGNTDKRIELQKDLIRKIQPLFGSDRVRVQDIVVKATNSKYNELKPGSNDEKAKKHQGLYTKEDVVNALENNDTSGAKEVLKNMYDEAELRDKTKEDIDKEVKRALTVNYKQSYIDGSESDRESIIEKLYSTGLYDSEDEVVKNAIGWLKSDLKDRFKNGSDAERADIQGELWSTGYYDDMKEVYDTTWNWIKDDCREKYLNGDEATRAEVRQIMWDSGHYKTWNGVLRACKNWEEYEAAK